MKVFKKCFLIILTCILCTIPNYVKALNITGSLYQNRCSNATDNYIYYLTKDNKKVWIYCEDMTSGPNSVIELCNGDSSVCYLPSNKTITMKGFNAKNLVINNLADKATIDLNIVDGTENNITADGDIALKVTSSIVNINGENATVISIDIPRRKYVAITENDNTKVEVDVSKNNEKSKKRNNK